MFTTKKGVVINPVGVAGKFQFPVAFAELVGFEEATEGEFKSDLVFLIGLFFFWRRHFSGVDHLVDAQPALAVGRVEGLVDEVVELEFSLGSGFSVTVDAVGV